MITQQEKDQWTAALESGEYEQAKYVLKNEKGYCCLGVLCDLVDPSGWTQPYPNSTKYKHGGTFTDGNVVLKSRLSQGIINKLVTMNDAWEQTFPQIAAWVRENVPVIEDQ